MSNMLSTFPLCIKGWLKVLDLSNEELQSDDWRSSGIISSINWHSKFCILLENDSRFLIFQDELTAGEYPIPPHMTQCRLDTELDLSQIGGSSCCVDDVSTTSSRNQDSDRYASNSSLSHANASKQYTRSGFFRNGSRFFRRAKSNSKLSSVDQSNKDNNFEINQSTKSVSNLKRSLSLSRLNRKKSEEKSDSKSPQSKMKNSLMTQSTGDLTRNVSTMLCHYLIKDTHISDVHTSFVGERPHCFSVGSVAETRDIMPNFEGKSSNPAFTTTYFAVSSQLEKQCWMKRLQQSFKPNMENENRVNNSLKLTIFESKSLPSIKRRYFCDVCLDKSPYAKTTSKLSSNDGCVFWAEDLILNNLPNFKTLTISLYKEPESGKDVKKKKKKHQNQCIGQISFNLSSLNTKSELQSWFNLRSPDILPDLSSNSTIQLRLKIRYQSLKVLKNDSYIRLHEIVTKHYLELIQFLEKNLPIKLKEDIAVCLVNIHEKNGTIVQFISDLISEEINDLENSSMTLRASTIVTKIIESHMKLVGSQYLHSILHSFIHDVMYENVTIEVDPTRFETGEDNKERLLVDNQHLLTNYLKRIWNKIYDSKNRDFPKQLKAVFLGWRNSLTATLTLPTDLEKAAAQCDVIVSGCIFLRLLCPAILSPHLFGLVSHFSEKSTVQRTLTLIAKSLQSLANFSKFGEKEHFMIFLNSCFDEEIPRMHEFLRSISSKQFQNEYDEEMVSKEIHCYGAAIDLPVEMARLHNCLMSDVAKEHINNSPKFLHIVKLPDIIHQITQQLIAFSVSQSNPSFFSSKKSQISNTAPTEQRRTSTGTHLNVKLLELGKTDKDISPPRLGSPLCQSSLVDPVSEYASHSDDVWQLRSDANNGAYKSTKPISNQSIVYSTKAQYSMSPIPKSQLNMPAIRRGHYNTHEIDPDQIDQSNLRVNELKSMFSSSNNRDNQLKSSIPKYVQPTKMKTPIKTTQGHVKKPTTKVATENHYSKVIDIDTFKPQSIKKHYQRIIELCDSDFYRENPLYDQFDITRTLALTADSQNLCPNSINKYFTVRNQVNLLEQRRRQSTNEIGDSQNEDFQHLCQELEDIRKEVQKEQLNDLKQLKSMLKKTGVTGKAYSSLNTPRTSSDHSQRGNQSNNMTTDVLDDVINNITIDGAGLDEAQQNLRKHIKKGKTVSKQHTAPVSRGQQSSLDSTYPAVGRNSEPNVLAAAADMCESQSDVTDSSSNRVHSPSSSNCSSMMSGLI